MYIYAEVTTPKPVDWAVSLKQSDKNPYGAYILYNSLADYFPGATINSYRKPPYNVLTEVHAPGKNTSAYFLLAPKLNLSKQDINELLRFAKSGNYVFIASLNPGKLLLDTLQLKTPFYQALQKDSTVINFTNPALRRNGGYTFTKYTIDDSFTWINKKDSATVLGITQQNTSPNFVQFRMGKGALFIHAAPLCFSNHFMLTGDNADYVNKAVSHIPSNIQTVYWDEYYKLGREGAATPLRVLLSNFWTRWALRIALLLMLTYILSGMKRKQRIIPILKPLENKSLSFAETVAALYYNRKENEPIVRKKMNFLTEFIRQRYALSTNKPDDAFVETLARKSNVNKELISAIFSRAEHLQLTATDEALVAFNKQLEQFYQQAKA